MSRKTPPDKPTDTCHVCKGRGWLTVNGWPTLCKQCHPDKPAAKKTKGHK